jgi:amino acid permease
LHKGSVRGSILALCAVAIGSGILSLPYVLKLNGWLIGILFILGGAGIAYLSMWMIIRRAI